VFDIVDCWDLGAFVSVTNIFCSFKHLKNDSIGYPIASFNKRQETGTNGGFNVGGINATGQVPQLIGNFGLIDVETPHEAYTKTSWGDGQTEMQLVFSDEFNTDGRSFYPGDDPYWEAVDLHYWVRFILPERNTHLTVLRPQTI